MLLTTDTRRTIKNSVCEEYLWTWMEAFLIDRKANGLAEGSLYFYRTKLQKFSDYCEAQAVKQIILKLLQLLSSNIYFTWKKPAIIRVEGTQHFVPCMLS